jgi:xylulokinase
MGSGRPAAGEATGLPVGIAVAAGGHDHVCGALAAGATTPGALLDSLGTAESLMMCLDHPIDDPWFMQSGYSQGAHVAPGMYYINGSVRASGSSVNWLRKLIGPETPLAALIEEASAVPPGAHGAMFLPHLWLGDAPHLDTRSRGALVGLSGELDRGAIVRAVLEGLAFEARAGFDPLLQLSGRESYPGITAIGGGARNELLLRIKASVMRATLRAIDVQEATSLGAAMLAAIGAGLVVDVADALRHVTHQVRLIEPDPAWVPAYDRLYTGAFCGLYAAIKDFHHTLHDLSAGEAARA